MKKILNTLLIFLLLITFSACYKQEEITQAVNGSATILYTNDVNGYINNKIKDEDEEIDGISYANVKALKDELISKGKNVLLVDAGDHVQGSVYSALSNGEDMIKIMNATGYDLATLGNHEFDYGQQQVFKLMDLANYDYVSCNFYNVSDNSLVLAPYKVLEAGDLKIAFIGITTPETITSSTPTYFQDADGNYIYGIYSGDDGSSLYEAVQKAIDEAKKEADVIIGLGHLGVEETSSPYTSKDVIENTSGLNAFIDGHSHTKIEGDYINDKDGNPVVLTQTQSYLSYIGQMEVNVEDGNISIVTSLIDDYDQRDKAVDELVQEVISSSDTKLNETVDESCVPFYINDPSTGERIVRKMETNSGDLAADAFYWYFNDYKDIDCDIAMYNAGGIRQDFPDGINTYRDCKSLMPYGNITCMTKVTGQELLDALDFSARSLPNESSLLHVAGMKYSIDTSIEPSATTDENGLWLSAPIDGYRVHDVEIYDKETGEYIPLDLNKEYTIGGINYLLRNSGSGLSMLKDCEVVLDYCEEDYLVLARYLSTFTDGIVNTANSPLNKYSNYLLNYENIYGSGRITID